MATGNDYDSEVQMFVQRPREIDLAHLRFLRWLAVRGSLEHEPAGRPYGVYALDDVPVTVVRDGREQTVQVRLGDRPTAQQR
jgi:hypothetical protein